MKTLPIIIAHRGARREAPENTLPAFTRALEMDCGGIEFDVLLTKDKVPIVTHNDDLSVLTQFRGYAHATLFSAIQSLDAGSHFSTATAGITMPTFTEVLELIQKHNILTIIEIKAQPGLTTQAAGLIGGIVSDFNLRGPFMVSSSSIKILKQLKHHYPKIPRALIIKQKYFSFLRASFLSKYLGLSAVHPSMKVVTQQFVNCMHEHHVEIETWTANEIAEFDRCVSLGVDGIITDDVAFAMSYIQKKFSGG